MGCLFLVALFLAWPTAGVSLILWVVFFLINSVLRARARMHFANVRRAERQVRAGVECLPSWVEDENQVALFLQATLQMAMRRGVPDTFFQAVFSNEEAAKTYLYFAGAMESQGASFLEQQIAVVDKVVEIWEQAPREVKMLSLAK